MLLATAIFAALNSDYPVLPPVPGSSTDRSAQLVPQLVEPTGLVDSPVGWFRWSWAGAEATCTMVLLDEELAEVHRQQVLGRELPVVGRLAQLLAAGSRFHWFVEVEMPVNGEVVASRPAAFGFSR